MTTRGTYAWREEHFGTKCTISRKKIPFAGMHLNVNEHCTELFTIIGKIFQKYGYTVDPVQTGCYNCRKIKGGNVYSSHAHAIAVDVNWHRNPYDNQLVTDIPQEAIDEILSLRTKSGQRCIKWGGDWDNRPETSHSFYDAMHFENIATPAELATGIIWEGGGMLANGSTGATVKYWQFRLKSRGYYEGNIDGDFGDLTEAAVKAAQNDAGQEQTGIIDESITYHFLEKKLGEIAPQPLPKSFVAEIKVRS